MKDSDDENFASIMAAMASAYQVDISASTTEMYFLFLKDLPFDKVQNAMVEIMATEESYKLPSIAKIRKKALGVEDYQLEGEAVEAWGAVLEVMPHVPLIGKEGYVGYYVSGAYVPIPNEVNKAVHMAFGGWMEFSKKDIKDETWDRLHFIRCYKATARKRQKNLLLGSREIKLLKE